MASRFLLITISLAAIAPPGRDQPETGQKMQVDEARLSAQGLADRFLEVRAKLDKPGDFPVYHLGEPIVVELEMRNMAEEHVFWIPRSGFTYRPAKSWSVAPSYMVTAKRYRYKEGPPPEKEDVPLTEQGKTTAEYLKQGPPVLSRSDGGPAWRFSDPSHPRVLKSFGGSGGMTEQPYPAMAMANLLCDMTVPGNYELEVRFYVRVLGIGPTEGEPATMVVRGPALRLFVDGRRYKLDSPL